jgi:type IV secretion system protein VirB6
MKLLRKHCFLLIATVMMAAALLPAPAFADDKCDNVDNKPTCTCFKELESKVKSGEEYILSDITKEIKEIIKDASKDLFEAFTGSAEYQAAVSAAATLMILVYAAGFMIGVVQASFGQVLKRLVILGIVFSIISPGGWNFFSQYAASFFNDGVDELIGGVLEIGTGIPYNTGDSPFVAIDGIAQYVASPDMIVAILGSTIGGGPYGLAMGFILGAAFTGLIKLLIDGLRIYAVTYLLRALLIGLAPIFVVFMFFEKTKSMFSSWVNALVNQSLQPILFFTFLSFFVVLLETATLDMLGGKELCWTEYTSVQGTQNKKSGWRFTLPNSNYVNIDKATWDGALSCKLEGKGGCEDFPINILDLLTFLILVMVATQFAKVVENIAQDISNAMVSLGHDTRMVMGKDSVLSNQGALNENAGNAPPKKR